jgi:diguanylate cyclase (GGDEF)-like protein
MQSPPSLPVAAAILAALAAGVMTLATTSHGRHRGYSVWLLAQWLAVVGLGLHAIDDPPPAIAALAQLLLLQWPVTLLLGLRRFHGRRPPRSHAGVDLALFGVAALVALAGAARLLPTWSATAAAALLSGYAAALTLSAPSVRDSAGMRLLAVVFGIGAGVGLAAAAAQARGGTGVPPALLALAALLAVGMGFAGLMLTHERTVAELRESRRRLRYLANIDMLTQVPNRRHFGELARRVLQRQEERSAAVLMFDIDHFKRINDELGHAAGDRALRVVARCVQEVLRADDIAGRHGGDEFALLLPGTDLRDAMGVATRIVRHAQDLAREQALSDLSLSFGMVQMRSDESVDEALRRADQALYEAKRQGRGRAVSADGDEQSPVFVESRRLGLV